MKALADMLLHSCGAVLFTARRRSGLFFLAAAFLSPVHGALGLLGALSGLAAGGLLARDQVWQKLGLFGGAGLLSGLALATYLHPDWRLLLIVPATAALAVLLALALIPWLGARDLPVLALPFATATLISLAAAKLFALAPSPGIHEPVWFLPWLNQLEGLLDRGLPTVLNGYLRSFGSLLFLPGLLSGLLVFAGVLSGSRITAIAMTAGGLAGTGLLQWIAGGDIPPAELGLIAFNSILLAAALSGVFIALTRPGLVWSLAAVGTGVLVAAALHQVLDRAALPVLALPFCVTTLLFLYPLKSGMIRQERWQIWAPPLALVGRAEDNLRAFERWRRDRLRPLPVLSLPLRGIWTVTQGPGGATTHGDGAGSQAWDFMLLDEDGRAAEWPAEELEQFYGHGCPVLAPADGVVTAAEGSLPDNPVHGTDTESPWGNWLMITHDTGAVSLLAHLRAGSLRAVTGQQVKRGQEVAQVGNSGRSPESHLHVQLNDGPWLASHSLPAHFGSWVEIRGNAAPVFHPLGRPEEGMQVCNLRDLEWNDWNSFFPFAMPGRIFSYDVLGPGGRSTVELILRSGSFGRLLLDDGAQCAQVLYWPGWIQLLPLPEGDPDWRCALDRGSLVQHLLLVSPVLPLKGPDRLEVLYDLYSPLLAGGLRRLFTLEGRGALNLSFATEDQEEQKLTWHSAVRGEDDGGWEARLRAGSAGLERIEILHGKRERLRALLLPQYPERDNR